MIIPTKWKPDLINTMITDLCDANCAFLPNMSAADSKMGSGPSMEQAPRNSVPEGKIRICVAGDNICPYAGRSRDIAALIAQLHPVQYETWLYFGETKEFNAFTKVTFDSVPFPPHLKGHASSPFVWLERGSEKVITPIGGNDHFSKWVLEQPELASNARIIKLVNSWFGFGDIFHNSRSDAPQSTADVNC
jgi:hypothetical protein